MKPSTSATDNPRTRAFFGGPDCRPRVLRDLLASRVSAVPLGGEIFWATYYFRDRALADALAEAGRRGVKVRLAIEAHPRTAAANLGVLEMLRDPDNLGSGCRGVGHFLPDNLRWKTPRLHIKLYYFSHPEPHCLVGTFNPSGNIPEDQDILAEIGDQDRGHNHLVELTDSRLVLPLRKHLLQLHSGHHGPWERLMPANNRVYTTDDSRLYLFPRFRRDVIRRRLLALSAGTTLRMAVSHLNDRGIVKALSRLSRKGVKIEIITHDTERRVPPWIETMLDGHMDFRRYRHPQGLPMHNKFILVDAEGTREIIFGSMNLSQSSLHANHELLVFSTDPSLYDAFLERWEQMLNEAGQTPA
jgi:hypothetical protein